MISIKYNSFFNKEGFLLDDAYDPFKRMQYINYFKEHQTEYICCQDADLKNLVGFIGIQYLTIPEEADNYQELEKISDLIGIELCGTQLCHRRRLGKLEISVLPAIERNVGFHRRHFPARRGTA